MIEYLRGIVIEKSDAHAILDVNGVGYGVEVTAAASASLSRGEEGELHTYLYVQEGVMRLYGFYSRQERELFEVFIGTSGIGPKTAVAILSSIEMATFARAILQGDLKTLTKIPGIGKKTAERLAVELRDKMKYYLNVEAPVVAGGSGESAAASDPLREAIEALEALGCKPIVAERAALKAAEILGAGATVSDLVREGLKHRH